MLIAQGTAARQSSDTERDQLFDAIQKVETIQLTLERSKIKTAAANELIQNVLGGRSSRLRAESGTTLGKPLRLNDKDASIGRSMLSRAKIHSKPSGAVTMVDASAGMVSRGAKLPGDVAAPHEQSGNMREIINLGAGVNEDSIVDGTSFARSLLVDHPKWPQ